MKEHKRQNGVDVMARRMRCRECGSENLQSFRDTNVKTTGKNYSGGQGCLGFLLFGPLGLLCGNCGQGQQTQVQQKTYWVCSKCGHKFRDPEEWRKEVTEYRHVGIASIVAGVGLGLILMISGAAELGLVLALMLGAAGVGLFLRSGMDMKKVDELDAFLNDQQ